MDEVCHFSNKYQPPNNLAKYKCFCTRNFTSIPHFEKNIGALHRKYFSENRLFTSFSTVREVCNISNKYWIPNKSAGNIFYTRHQLKLFLHAIKIFAFSIAAFFRNIHILTHFYYFSQWIRCAIFQINTNLLLIYQNINIFTQETLYLFIIWKKRWHCPSQNFLKHPLFKTFSLFLTMSEVCNISNKC